MIGIFTVAALVFIFDLPTLFESSNKGQRKTATIQSIESVMVLDKHNDLAKLSLNMTNGETVKAIRLRKNLSNCSIGDKVFVRLLKRRNVPGKWYRVVSEQCLEPDW